MYTFVVENWVSAAFTTVSQVNPEESDTMNTNLSRGTSIKRFYIEIKEISNCGKKGIQFLCPLRQKNSIYGFYAKLLTLASI